MCLTLEIDPRRTSVYDQILMTWENDCCIADEPAEEVVAVFADTAIDLMGSEPSVVDMPERALNW